MCFGMDPDNNGLKCFESLEVKIFLPVGNGGLGDVLDPA